MKKFKSIFILALLVFGFSFKTKIKPFEGSIKYAVDYHSEYGSIKYPQDFNVYIKGDIIRIDFSLPFAEIGQIIDCKKRTYIKLCVIDGKKYCVKGELTKASYLAKVIMVKDSTQTINKEVCSLGRINEEKSRYVIYATEKYQISKNITACGGELPYRLFYPQKEFTTKLIMKQDAFDKDGQTTYEVEIITESQLKDSDILPSTKDYKELTEEELGDIIKNYFKSAR